MVAYVISRPAADIVAMIRKGRAVVSLDGSIVDTLIPDASYTAPLPTLTKQQRTLAYCIRNELAALRIARENMDPYAKFLDGKHCGMVNAAEVLYGQSAPLTYAAILSLADSGNYWAD